MNRFTRPPGGGSSEAIYLVRELVRRGHHVRLFCPQVAEPERVQREFQVALEPFTRWPMGRYTPWRNLKYLLFPLALERQVRQRLQNAPCDVVLSQHAIAAVTAGRLKRRLGRATVMNFLDYLTGFMEAWPPYVAPPFLLQRLEAFELSLPRRYAADGVLAISDTLADYIRQTGYPPERIRPIYFGFDSAVFPLRRPEQVPPADRPVVVMHGSFDQHHLGPIALEGLAWTARQQPQTVFRFVGRETASLQQFVRRLRAAAPQAQIELTGFTPYEAVASHLQTATVGIVPYEETKGTHCAFVAKIVEYLAVGLPVVSTAIQSASRYFANVPSVRFTPFAGPAFGTALLQALKRPALEQWDSLAGASERVRRELDWQVISRRAVDFVEEIARQHQAAHR